MSSTLGSETTPSTVAALLVHQPPPPKNPSGAWGTASVRRHAAGPARALGPRGARAPPRPGLTPPHKPYLAHRGAAPDLSPL